MDGKRHKIFFPEGKGFTIGCSMLIDNLRALGEKRVSEEIVAILD